jgi:hypothetical protein
MVVETASQFGTMVAGSGPAWSGLHPGSFSRSTAAPQYTIFSIGWRTYIDPQWSQEREHSGCNC